MQSILIVNICKSNKLSIEILRGLVRLTGHISFSFVLELCWETIPYINYINYKKPGFIYVFIYVRVTFKTFVFSPWFLLRVPFRKQRSVRPFFLRPSLSSVRIVGGEPSGRVSSNGFVWKCCVPLNPLIMVVFHSYVSLPEGKWVCLKMWLVPLNPMVLLIIIPMKNGYFIGGILHFQTYPNVFSCGKHTLSDFAAINGPMELFLNGLKSSN